MTIKLALKQINAVSKANSIWKDKNIYLKHVKHSTYQSGLTSAKIIKNMAEKEKVGETRLRNM
jgi:hypothetical protein